MNKKGEGTASKMFILLIIFLAGIMTISGLVTNLVGEYGRSDLPEFKPYEIYYNETQTLGNEIHDTQTGENFSSTENERQEDISFRQAFAFVDKIKGSVKYYVGTIQVTFRQMTKFNFPAPVTSAFSIIIVFTIIVLIIRVVMRYDKI